MKKRTPTHPAPPPTYTVYVPKGAGKTGAIAPPTVSGHGLTKDDEATLRCTLMELEGYVDRMHLTGSSERERFLFVLAKVKIRLAPPPIDGLVDQARELISRYGVTLDSGRERTRQRDAEFAEISAQRVAAREARAKLIAAKAAEKERLQQAALKAWQGK